MITGVVLARNEEANIVACLEAFRPHVDEVILIDMESEDRTVELAAPWIARTISHPKVPNFDAARNVAIEPARHDWLWFCDADERISAEVGQAVRNLVRERGHEFEALTIPFKTYFCGKWIEHCGWWPGYTMPRVMKRGHFRFREQLHGGVQVDGRELRFSPDPRLGIDHYSYLSVTHYYEKFNRYTSTEATQLAARGTTWDWRSATQAMIRDLWMYYERNQGRADGAHGWILSWLSGQYRWASHAKLIDAEPGRSSSPNSCPADLDEFLDEVRNELARLRGGAIAPPLDVLWCTPLEDPSGYAEEGRCFTHALAAGKRPLRVEAIRWSDREVAISPRDRALYRALQAVPRSAQFIAITNCIPTLAKPVGGAALNILRTTFETDRLPNDWLPRLEPFDEIWVISNYNRDTFIRSGVAPEKLRVVPSCLDTELFTPDGPRGALPTPCAGRFVFLSVFDWQLRKGWDVLLKAYVREFSVADNAVLLIKVTRLHGHSAEAQHRQAAAALASAQTSFAHRPDIVFFEELLDGPEMAALYRSADAFVLSSRGEGWGRPYMEAMACGMPTIGVAASGNVDFMTTENSLLVPVTSVPVSDEAAHEIFVFRGHRWFEPDEHALRQAMRQLHGDAELRKRLGTAAARSIHDGFGIPQAAERLEQALVAAERRFASGAVEPSAPYAVRVEWQGEFLAGHSFSNINEHLAREFAADPQFAVSLTPRFPITSEQLRRNARGRDLEPLVGHATSAEPQVVIRHAYPPDWSEVTQAKWIHIQPWEFGWLPTAWVAPLRDRVDEIWAPSHYVRKVYERSGIPANKIHVIPWGVDPEHFHAQAVPRLLPTNKSFRFVYVGGTVARKGFDLLLQAYLAEFRHDEDVTLVIKDVGVATVYRYGNFRREILEAIGRPETPEILYFDDDMTTGQVASLLTSCHCLVAPYRGEGFGLPILEAMACGVAPLVPRGGPSDDFIDDTCGYFVASREVRVQHPEPLCGPPTELEVDLAELRRTMRRAFEQRERTAVLGRTAAEKVCRNYSWKATAEAMKRRIGALLAMNTPFGTEAQIADQLNSRLDDRLPLTVIVSDLTGELEAAEILARSAPFVRELIVELSEPNEAVAAIAREYGARVARIGGGSGTKDGLNDGTGTTQDFVVRLSAHERPREQDWDRVGEVIGRSFEGTTSVALSGGRSWTLRRRTDPRSSVRRTASSPGMAHFQTEFLPFLDRRSRTFQAMVDYLENECGEQRRIVETGCIRMPDDWGAGQSTLIFDRFIAASGGSLLSIDNDPRNCEFARRNCRAASTTVVCNDSIRELSRLATDAPQSIDLLYLDSFDVDWSNVHPSAMHHMNELCAARQALKPGALVVVDDHQGPNKQPGKSLYVADFMRSIQARLLFEEYQIGWIVP